MSVYKPNKSRFWQYDFVLKGRRFHGSTGQASRRAAEAVERQRRLEAATGALGSVANLTLNEAAGRYWAEVGVGRGDAKDVERRIAQLLALFGQDTRLADIDQVAVAQAIERRRGKATVRSRKAGAAQYLPANATVNRDVIETLRPILRRARTHWTARSALHGLPDIDWRDLRLREPRALSRLYSDEQRAAWREALQEDLRLALDLLLTNGLRFGELFFHPDKVSPDPTKPTLTLQKGRKRDVILHIPIRADHGRELAARAALALEAGLETVWFYETIVRRKKVRVAYTYAQLEYRITKAADDAGIAGGRRIHGARHHAGSTVLKRSKGNLKAVQGMLGHASIASSQRYAHVLIDDLRGLIEDEPIQPNPQRKAKAR